MELPLLKCQKVRNILPIQYHATLGFQDNHIVPISKPKEAIFYIVCLRLIVITEMLPHAWNTRGAYKGLPSSQTSAKIPLAILSEECHTVRVVRN